MSARQLLAFEKRNFNRAAHDPDVQIRIPAFKASLLEAKKSISSAAWFTLWYNRQGTDEVQPALAISPNGGGGGAGGLLTGSTAIVSGSYTVTVGAGGASRSGGSGVNGATGQNTTGFGLTAYGGGGGVGTNGTAPTGLGASGGGGASSVRWK